MNKTIAVIKGDGIGPEIVSVTLDILDKTAEKFGHTFTYHEVAALSTPTVNVCPRKRWMPVLPATACYWVQ